MLVPPVQPLTPPATQPAVPPSPVLLWRRVFPGQEAELRRVRSWLAELLPSGPAREDVVTVAVELAANAVRHTASGGQGFFAVELTWQMPPVTVRVAVADGGARTTPHLAPGTDPLGPGPLGIQSPGTSQLSVEQLGSEQLSDHGRGLHVVRALAERTGVCGDHRGRLVWAEIRWSTDGTAQPEFPDGYEGLVAGRPGGAGVPLPGGRHLVRPRHHAVVGHDRPSGEGPPGSQAAAHGRVPVDLAQLLDVARATAPPAPARSRGRHGVTGRRAGPGPGGPPASKPGREYGLP